MATKKISDAIGNELIEGDLVLVKIGNETLTARVGKLSTGGVAIGSSGQETPPFAAFAFLPYTIICNADPRTGQHNTALRNIWKIHDPESAAVLDKIMDSH